MDLKSNGAPESSKLSMGVIVSLVVVLILIAIVLILAKSGKLNRPEPTAPTGNQLTEEQKAEIIEQLQQANEEVEPLTETEKAAVVKQLQQANEDVKPLTEAEKADIIRQLQEASLQN